MKKSTTIVIAALAIFISSFNSVAQNCVKQGSFIIAGFYGYPYVTGAVIKTIGQNTDKVKNLNHIGGKLEYMVSDKIGLGIEATYASASVMYQDSVMNWYKAGIKKLRVLPKMNVHFGTTESLDPYFTVGAGYKSTDIYVEGPEDSGSLNINLVPVSMRIGVGLHYFFTDYVGLNAEVGLGGPAIQVGLAVKL
ncbi:MAG: porin family protein [Bacteroidia bacterium]